MDSLNSLVSTLREQWSQAQGPTKLVVASTLAIALMLAAFGISWRGGANYEALFSGRTFTQQQIISVETALSRAGLSEYRTSKSSTGDFTVTVPAARRSAYIAAIVEGNALPRDFDLDLEEALNKTNPFESSAQWKARIELAKQRELAKILCSMSEIDDASVQFDEEHRGGLHNERRVRAMVAVRPRAGTQLDPARVRSIRQLVASSRAFLEPAAVTVTDLMTGASYVGARDLEPTLLQSDEYSIRKTKLEKDWTEKIRSVLAHIPGVEVAANVELTLDTDSRNATPAFHTSSIAVSVGVPSSYFHRVRQANGPRLPQATPNAASIRKIESETADRICNLVRALLPTHLASSEKRVTVASFTDVSPVRTSKTNGLAQIFRNPMVVMCGLGVLAIGVLLAHGIWQDIEEQRLKLQLATTNAATDSKPVDVLPMTDLGEAAAGTNVESEGMVHKELTQLVREDPDAAAKMLGEWVRRAS